MPAWDQVRESLAFSPQYPMYTEYRDLVTALNSTVSKGLHKIDILLDSHPLPLGVNVVVEDTTISIPQKTLKKAFLTARNVFFDNLEGLERYFQKQEAVLDASAVMLLLAPEDLTAANARKRVILVWEKESGEKGRKRIVEDLWMLNSMFMSELNKHTKSPTLWAHRRWLIQRISSPEPLQMEGTCSSLPLRNEREISAVGLMAAQIHPRNYYAWRYMRWWILRNPELLNTSDTMPFGLPRMVNLIQEWCLRHPSDTSGWSFLLWLLTSTTTWTSDTLSLYGPFATVSKEVLDRTRSLKLRNESLWVFLRTVMASKDMPAQTVQAFLDDAKTIIESKSERPKSQSIARAALKWLEQYGSMPTLPKQEDDDHVDISQPNSSKGYLSYPSGAAM